MSSKLFAATVSCLFALVSMICSPVWAADFQGVTFGNYMLYFPGTKVKFVQPVYAYILDNPKDVLTHMPELEEAQKSLTNIGFDNSKVVIVNKIKTMAEKTAADKGYTKYSISGLSIYVNGFFTADILFW